MNDISSPISNPTSGAEQTQPQVARGIRDAIRRKRAHQHDAFNTQVDHAAALREHLSDGRKQIRCGQPHP
jgi:hypothetical protein